MRREFIFEEAPFRSCHASTIAETGHGLIAAWFGGTQEGADDVGIWIARKTGSAWSAPEEVADDRGFPCWNPVLHRMRDGNLWLFYKAGPSPRAWWGMTMLSRDGGETWSVPTRLPDGIPGPIKNKPISLANGRILSPSSSEDAGWRIHMEWTDDPTASWGRTDALNDGEAFAAIQPTLLAWPDGRIQALCRTRQGVVAECWSADQGVTWTELAATHLPNPNSGIDAVSLADGRALLIYNHTERGRSPLNLAISEDGKAWKEVLVLEDEPGEYSYPAIIQADDGAVHMTWTWRRERICHATLGLDEID